MTNVPGARRRRCRRLGVNAPRLEVTLSRELATARIDAPPAAATFSGVQLTAIAAGLLAAIVIRAILLPTQGLRDDTDQFAGWIAHIATNGLPKAYDENLSFGPVLAYIWGLLGFLEPAFRNATDASDTGLRMLMKLPAVLADFGLAACVAWILRATPRWAAVGAVAVLLHPAVWYVSAWWGQYESIYVLAALLAVLFAVGGRDGFAAAALAVAVLAKPQALPFLLPFAAWFLARGGLVGLLKATAIGAAVAFLIWLPFLAAGGPMRYLANLGEYQNDIFSVLSLRAWNFWWLVQELAPVDEFVSDRVSIIGPISFRTLGYAITGLLALWVAMRIWRDPQPRTLILGLAATTLVSFTFLTTMHERYAFGALAFLMLVIPDARVRWLGIAFGVLFTLNLVAAIPATEDLGRLLPVWSPLGVLASIAMVVLTSAVLLVLWLQDGADSDPGSSFGSTGSGPLASTGDGQAVVPG
jgi:Gpi18-like mannosyltransferase